MKRKKITNVFICLLLILSISVVPALADETDGAYTTEQIRLMNLPIEILIDEMVEVYNSNESVLAGMDHAIILKERICEIDESDFLPLVIDKDVPEVVRVTLIQLSKDIPDRTESLWNQVYTNLALDSEENVVVRQNAIIELPNSMSTANLLEQLVLEEQGLVSFQALKCLNMISQDKAVALADCILETWEQEDLDTVRQAIKVKARNLQEIGSETDIQNFISKCESILDKPKVSILSDTIFFSLEDMQNIDAIKAIVKSDKIDAVLKEYCITKNEKEISTYITSAADIDPEFISGLETYSAAGFGTEKLNSNLLSAASLNPKAATSTNYSGYAIFRDGALFGLNWHAGLISSSTISTTSNCIIHMNYLVDGVKNENYSKFLDDENNEPMGIYRPKTGLTSSKKTAVIATARELTTESIPYVITQQLDYYNATATGSDKGEPSDISNIRCDGVTEYSYEYNGIRICGNDTYWDISIRNYSNLNQHAASKATPRLQAETYMTLVSSTIPGV